MFIEGRETAGAASAITGRNGGLGLAPIMGVQRPIRGCVMMDDYWWQAMDTSNSLRHTTEAWTHTTPCRRPFPRAASPSGQNDGCDVYQAVALRCPYPSTDAIYETVGQLQLVSAPIRYVPPPSDRRITKLNYSFSYEDGFSRQFDVSSPCCAQYNALIHWIPTMKKKTETTQADRKSSPSLGMWRIFCRCVGTVGCSLDGRVIEWTDVETPMGGLTGVIGLIDRASFVCFFFFVFFFHRRCFLGDDTCASPSSRSAEASTRIDHLSVPTARTPAATERVFTAIFSSALVMGGLEWLQSFSWHKFSNYIRLFARDAIC